MDIYEVTWGKEKREYINARWAYKKFKKLTESEVAVSICRHNEQTSEEVLRYDKYSVDKFSYINKAWLDGSDRILEEYYFKAMYEEFPFIGKITADILTNLSKQVIIVNSRDIKSEIIKYFKIEHKEYNKVYVLVSDAVYINIDNKYNGRFEYKNRGKIKAYSFEISNGV